MIAEGELMSRMLIFGIALVLGSCATTAPAPQTASGKAEVTIQAPAQVIKSALINEMINRGYRIVRDSEYELAFEHVITNVALVMLLGTSGGGAPTERVTYQIAALGPSTRVIADIAVISNSGTAFEKRIETSQGADAPNVQALLDKVASDAGAATKVARK